MGESHATDFHLRFYGRRSYEFSYQSYDGFYLKNTDELASGLAPAGVKYQRSDIKARNLGAVMHWNLKEEDYTLAVGFAQDGRQLQSGWAYFASVAVGDNKIYADDPFVPPSAATKFERLGTLKELDRKYAGVGGALGGIWVHGPWYLTGFAAIGPSWQKVVGRFSGSDDFDESFVGFFSDAKVGGGYNGQIHVFDIQVHSDNTTTDFLGGAVDTIQLEARFTYSYRMLNVDIPILNSLSSFLD
ncbi:DUF4421 family protein [Bdellovibrio bacteriovorus]|uniref:DUF4421 family protein n=1 Tax=Bdellovibrio bacteriovorus TaxID=959 RepID=UPI0021D199F5|nr:DUF4421 family protein [Bdellovibrio bacteriovorus]UXR66155.1 DUF4421 family protein [Bdellovibrio bacteriovorus]